MARVCNVAGCPVIAVDKLHCDEHRAENQKKKRTQRSEAGQSYQSWLTSRRWRKRRIEHLSANPYCQCPAHQLTRVKGDDPAFGGMAIVDHIKPHRGDYKRFWFGPLQTLTKRCHDGWKQRSERA